MSTVSTQEEAKAKAKAIKKEGANESRQLSDEDWLASLVHDKTYSGIDIRHEHGKMIQWCAVNHKQPTRRRFVNWLNRSERPMKPVKSARDRFEVFPQRPSREPSEEELAAQRKIVRDATERLKSQFKEIPYVGLP